MDATTWPRLREVRELAVEFWKRESCDAKDYVASERRRAHFVAGLRPDLRALAGAYPQFMAMVSGQRTTEEEMVMALYVVGVRKRVSAGELTDAQGKAAVTQKLLEQFGKPAAADTPASTS